MPTQHCTNAASVLSYSPPATAVVAAAAAGAAVCATPVVAAAAPAAVGLSCILLPSAYE